ncbi:MAG: hypothetical protein HQM09_10850 [Candidatus Riflebacteria bacterium]|nr:hypothetical protein [Candidatus Riflebacteria bacterium]
MINIQYLTEFVSFLYGVYFSLKTLSDWHNPIFVFNPPICYSIRMVRLDSLNAECARRRLARAFPAQIACRIFGNKSKPCQLDPICRPSEKHGPVLFYTIISAAAILLFIAGYWIARLTGVALILRLLRRLFLPPLRMLAVVFRDMKSLYDSLTESA